MSAQDEDTTMIEDEGQDDHDLKTAESHAADALERATAARENAQKEVTDLEARLADAHTRAFAAEEKRKALSMESARGDSSAQRGFKKHTQEKEKADEEIAMLDLAIPEAKRAVKDLDRAWYEAEADLQWTQFQILRADLERVSRQFDAYLQDGSGLIAERERILNSMRKCGVIGGLARTNAQMDVQTLGQCFSAIAKAEDTHPALKRALDGVRQAFPLSQTLLQKDRLWLKSAKRPNAVKRWQAAQPTAVPGTGDPAASGMGHGWGAMPEQQTRRVPHIVTERTEVKLGGSTRRYPVPPTEINPLTSARIIRQDDGGTRSVGIEYGAGDIPSDNKVLED